MDSMEVHVVDCVYARIFIPIITYTSIWMVLDYSNPIMTGIQKLYHESCDNPPSINYLSHITLLTPIV